MHESGPLSSWAQASQAGDAVEFAGPRNGDFTLRPGSHWVVLIGDETALPTIQAILASAPVKLPGLVLIETDHPGEHEAFFVGPNIMLSWVKRTQDRSGAAYPLVEALERQVILQGTDQAWMAGESGSVMALRTMLNETWKLEKTDISAKAYWKSGVAHFRS